ILDLQGMLRRFFQKKKKAIILLVTIIQRLRLEGISFNMPVVIEVIEEKSKLEPLLPQIKRMVGDNGLATLQEVEVL
ncbi:MAG: DUF190 domain-containing protein, partial [Nitrososphaeraceae archaeon]